MGTAQTAGTGTAAPGGNDWAAAAPSQAGATTTVAPSRTATSGSEDGYPDTSPESTQTVPPNYPVVTSPPASTTTSTPTSSAPDR
ncbi:MAG TPA: hypothetical protein VFH58_14560 [Acidimicrobiales bacterium]|nr:hypothetical protein [Acidimicrobiales bacterium]